MNRIHSPPTDDAPGTRAAESWKWYLAVALAVVATSHALWTLRDFAREWNDFAFVYAAGRVWLSGGSPYDVPLWRSQWDVIYPSFAGVSPPVVAPSAPYLYPPHWSIIAVPLGALPWAWASRVWDAINVAAYGAIFLFVLRLVAPRIKEPFKRPWVWLCIAVASLNGATRWTFWECQLSMVPTLGVVGAYWAWAFKRPRWLVFFVFVALLKPQIGVLPMAYLALIGGFGGVVGGAIAVALFSALSLAHVDWTLLPGQLQNCVQLHLAISYNHPESFYGLSSILAVFGHRSFLSPLLGLALMVLLAAQTRQLSRRDPAVTPSPQSQLAVACAACAAFLPLHGYDLVILNPILFWIVKDQRKWVVVPVLLLVLVASRGFSLSAAHGLRQPVAPWLAVVLAVVCVTAWFLEHSVRRYREPRPLMDAD